MSFDDVPLYTKPQDRLKGLSEHERAAIPLWEDRYSVQVMQRDMITDEELNALGRFSCGDEAEDEEIMKYMITTLLPVSDIVGFFKKGKPITINRQQDTKLMFDNIERYLLLWRHTIATDINYRKPPINDLIDLASMACKLYPYASVQGGLAVHFNFFMDHQIGYNRHTLLGGDVKPAEPERATPLYEGHVEFFSGLAHYG